MPLCSQEQLGSSLHTPAVKFDEKTPPLSSWNSILNKDLELNQNTSSTRLWETDHFVWLNINCIVAQGWMFDSLIHASKGSSCSLISSGAWNVHHQPNTSNRKTAYKIPIEAWRQLTCNKCNPIREKMDKFCQKRTNNHHKEHIGSMRTEMFLIAEK